MSDLNVKDLILSGNEKNLAAPVKKKKAAPAVSYEVVLASGCDIAVRRKTAKTSRLLVMLLSQNQYYVKDEIGGNITNLTRQEFTSFSSSLPDGGLKIPDVNWLHEIRRGKEFAERLMDFLGREKAVSFARTGRSCFVPENGCTYGSSAVYSIDSDNVWWAAKEASTITGEPLRDVVREVIIGIRSSRFSVNNGSLGQKIGYRKNIIDYMFALFGRDNARKLVREYIIAGFDRMPDYLNNISDQYTYGRKILGGVTFGSIDAVIDYVVYDIQREGFLFNPREFWELWDDDLKMQKNLYGKIREKYPKNLATHHMQMSALSALHRQEIDGRKWVKAAESMLTLRWENAEYIVTSPESPDDMHEEAKQQCNCLASYVRKVADGESRVVFLRKRKAPDESLVTIEVVGDHVVQVKARNNRNPGAAEWAAVMKWAKDKGLSVRDAPISAAA